MLDNINQPKQVVSIVLGLILLPICYVPILFFFIILNILTIRIFISNVLLIAILFELLFGYLAMYSYSKEKGSTNPQKSALIFTLSGLPISLAISYIVYLFATNSINGVGTFG